MKLWLFILAVATALPLAAKDKKSSGEIPDRAAFVKIRTYCVDSEDHTSEVRAFIERESKPKKLLTKLPWKLYVDCREDDPDVVIKVEFLLLSSVGILLGAPENPDRLPEDAYKTRAVLEISDPASGHLVYKVEAAPLENSLEGSDRAIQDPPVLLRLNALYNAFSTLIADLKRVPQADKK